MELHPAATDSTDDNITFLNGCTFSFSYNAHRIELWISNFSGAESLRVDGHVVSESRVWRKVSCHDIELDGQRLRVSIHIESLLKGPVFVVLSHLANNRFQPIAAKHLELWPAQPPAPVTTVSTRTKRLKTLGEVALAFAAGYFLSRHFDVFSWQFFLGIFVLIITAMTAEHWLKKVLARRNSEQQTTTAESSGQDVVVTPLDTTEIPAQIVAQIERHSAS